MKQQESEHQQALFQWAQLARGKYPELALMFHIPNGGKRDYTTAARLKAEGVLPGIPDIMLPVSRGGYHGLWVELKADHGKPSRAQLDYIDRLREQGYAALICYGWQIAREEIENYLNLPKGETQDGKL